WPRSAGTWSAWCWPGRSAGTSTTGSSSTAPGPSSSADPDIPQRRPTPDPADDVDHLLRELPYRGVRRPIMRDIRGVGCAPGPVLVGLAARGGDRLGRRVVGPCPVAEHPLQFADEAATGRGEAAAHSQRGSGLLAALQPADELHLGAEPAFPAGFVPAFS